MKDGRLSLQPRCSNIAFVHHVDQIDWELLQLIHLARSLVLPPGTPWKISYMKLQVAPFCLRCCLSSWPLEKSGWCRVLNGIDALLNALDFSINQMKHDHTPDQESKPHRKDGINHALGLAPIRGRRSFAGGGSCLVDVDFAARHSPHKLIITLP